MEHSLLTGSWLRQFGEFDGSGMGPLTVGATQPVDSLFHAEAHNDRVLGADFRYSAVLDGEWLDNGLRE
jgi:hypothetical protein